MTRMRGPDCAVMCNLINTHTRMTRMTRPDCAVMCNLVNTHTHTHTHLRPMGLNVLGYREISVFPVQLTTRRIGNHIRVIHTLLYVMTIHTYYYYYYYYYYYTVVRTIGRKS